MYKNLIDSLTKMISTRMIERVSDGARIPFDPANMDYQEYLKWLAEGNTPLPPDDPINT